MREPSMTPGEYWDTEWRSRISGGSVKINVEKGGRIINELCKRPYYIDKEKLDVGCGPSYHARHMAGMMTGWIDKYTGIDLSPSVIERSRKAGLNVICGDIFGLTEEKKYDLFLFLDSLEHIKERDLLAEKVRKLAAKGFMIFGNIPLYLSLHEVDGEKFENTMNFDKLVRFVNICGARNLWHEIYGVNGYPYMIFEAY